MLALVEIAGGQYEVQKSKKLIVPLLKGNEGDIVEFKNIYLFNEDGNLSIGQPFVDGVVVKAKILGVKKDKKVLVFHKKRRKGYQKLNGHRQKYTQIEIIDIVKN